MPAGRSSFARRLSKPSADAIGAPIIKLNWRRGFYLIGWSNQLLIKEHHQTLAAKSQKLLVVVFLINLLIEGQ